MCMCLCERHRQYLNPTLKDIEASSLGVGFLLCEIPKTYNTDNLSEITSCINSFHVYVDGYSLTCLNGY